MSPLVSVVLPVRNAEETIGAAIRSVLDQSHGDFELLVVDDGSEDGSRARVAEFRDERLQLLINRGTQGVAEAMQYGVERARAPWIARMDADDLSRPDRLKQALAWVSRYPDCAAVTGRVRLIEAQGDGMRRHVDWLNGFSSSRELAVSRFIESPVAHPASMIRAEWLKKIGGYRRVRWAEDHDMWMRLFEAGGVVEMVPEVLLDWRDSPGRLTRADDRYGDAARMEMRCHYLARLDAVGERGVVIAGAGPIGKSLSRGLRSLGVRVDGFFEVHPRRIGECIHGVPVRSSDEMAHEWRDRVLLGAVGIPGGRDQLRELAASCGRVEGEDFWLVC